ncbi:MAG TPA: hypothetical protein VFV43_09075 [Limnobacter sp.]|nr:hypothetical protein [Limnobacter sp.]
MILSTFGQWSHRQVGDKWVVSKWVRERMRLGADGTMAFYHGDTPEFCTAELYEFQTEWAAQAHAQTCNRLDQVLFDLHLPSSSRIEFSRPMFPGSSGLIPIGRLGFCSRLAASPIGRAAHAFWYGWGRA